MALENLTPVTRKESILNGEDITPVTREEYFWKKAASGGGGDLPEYDSDDAGKALQVNSDGTGLEWKYTLPVVDFSDYVWTDAPPGLYAKANGQVVQLSSMGTLVKGLGEAGLMFEQSVDNYGQTVFSALKYTAMNTEEFDGEHLHGGDYYVSNVVLGIMWASTSSSNVYINIPDDAIIIEKQ